MKNFKKEYFENYSTYRKCMSIMNMSNNNGYLNYELKQNKKIHFVENLVLCKNE